MFIIRNRGPFFIETKHNDIFTVVDRVLKLGINEAAAPPPPFPYAPNLQSLKEELLK